MQIERFHHHDHLEYIEELLKLRKLPLTFLDDIPTYGFIAFTDDDEAVATAFIRFIEGGAALIDGLITDPRKSPELRNMAIDLIVQALLDASRQGGIKKMIAYTIDEGTLTRAIKKYGFVQQPHTLIVLDF